MDNQFIYRNISVKLLKIRYAYVTFIWSIVNLLFLFFILIRAYLVRV